MSRIAETQARLLDIAARLVRPGGALVYAVCSLFSAEGADQISSFLSRTSGWSRKQGAAPFGRRDGEGILLTPDHDGTDGFFVARLEKAC